MLCEPDLQNSIGVDSNTPSYWAWRLLTLLKKDIAGKGSLNFNSSLNGARNFWLPISFCIVIVNDNYRTQVFAVFVTCSVSDPGVSGSKSVFDIRIQQVKLNHKNPLLHKLFLISHYVLNSTINRFLVYKIPLVPTVLCWLTQKFPPRICYCLWKNVITWIQIRIGKKSGSVAGSV